MAVFDRNVKRILLVELKPYDVVGAAITPKYVASEHYETCASDTPANTIYIGCVADDVFIDRAMFTGDNIGGVSLPDFGTITVNNPKRPVQGARFDDWIDPTKFAWQGRAISVYVIAQGAAHSSKTLVFDGIINDIQYDENTIGFSLRNKLYLLDTELQETRYSGAGGDEGGDDLEGKTKPLCFGRISNIEPVFVDTSLLRYQYHDGAVQSNDASRDKGSPLTVTTDYTNDYTDGFIDLVAEADGLITMDVKGSTLGGTYSAQPADIMEYLVETLRGVTDINTASIAAVNSAAGYEVGYYTGTENPNTLDALTELAKTFFGYYGFNRAGEFDVGIFGAPALSATLSLDESDIVLGSMQRQTLGEVTHKVTVNARPNWVTQDKDNFAGSVTEANKALYGKEYQLSVSANDATVLTKYPEARELIVDTSIYDATDAQSLADDMLDFWKVSRSIFTLTANLRPLSVEINDTIEITHSRFNLSSGTKFRVIRFREFYLQNKVELTVVG